MTGNAEIEYRPHLSFAQYLETRATKLVIPVRDTKFGTNVSNEILMNAENARVTALTVFELLRENQQEGRGGSKITRTPPRLGLRPNLRVNLITIDSLVRKNMLVLQLKSILSYQVIISQMKNCIIFKITE